MNLESGQNLGNYQIVASLGAGGMGEVWRAEDTSLRREVALKILPANFAENADRHTRFEREARVLASLNHPNIATLYGLEHLDGEHALVMELVEGEALDAKLARGGLPVVEAMNIALQIAEALEAAHEQGIVHRDLKPANVMIRPDGRVKVLDFGLAKTWLDDGDESSLSMSPTITRHNTAAGVILGTAAYMSPEQARGKPVDRRADIWAFGVVLWEMFTGRKLFAGDTVSDVLASVLKESPDLSAVPDAVPAAARRLLARCLDREPSRRLQAVGEARIALSKALSEDADEASDSTPIPPRVGVPAWWRVAALLLLGIMVTAAWFARPNTPPDPKIVRAFIAPPEGTGFELDPGGPGAVAVSPDGQNMVFTARHTEGKALLWVRPLNGLEARPLPGTEDAAYPFWSPDGRNIGFFARGAGKLRRIAVGGGPPLTICDAQNGKGGSWSEDGRILFTPAHNTPIFVVEAAGGKATQLTEVGDDEAGHRFPLWLPDNRFVYLSRSRTNIEDDRVMTASIDTPTEGQVLLAAASNVAFASGNILFMREQNLMAQPFDPTSGKLGHEALPVAENVLYIGGARFGVFSAAAQGMLVYHSGAIDRSTELVWMDRDGQETDRLGDGVSHRDIRLAPHGDTVAAEVLDLQAGTSDIWLYDVRRALRTRFTFDPTMDWFPVFSPTGEQLVFSSGRSGSNALWLKDLSGAEPERLLHEIAGADLGAEDWSPDGKWIVYTEIAASERNIYALPVDGGEPEVVAASSFQEWQASLSPDGRWIAFTTDRSGRAEVYVTTFPNPGRQWQVSSDGGQFPHWREDGSELYYVTPSSVLAAVEVADDDGTLIIGTTEHLFGWPRPSGFGQPYAVSDDGQHFLVNQAVESIQNFPLTLVLNWDAELDNK